MVRDAPPYKKDSRYAVRKRASLDTGRVVLRRMTSGTGSVGAVAMMKGIPSSSVATAKPLMVFINAFGRSWTLCSAN